VCEPVVQTVEGSCVRRASEGACCMPEEGPLCGANLVGLRSRVWARTFQQPSRVAVGRGNAEGRWIRGGPPLRAHEHRSLGSVLLKLSPHGAQARHGLSWRVEQAGLRVAQRSSDAGCRMDLWTARTLTLTRDESLKSSCARWRWRWRMDHGTRSHRRCVDARALGSASSGSAGAPTCGACDRL
jgi:hypothetical protein